MTETGRPSARCSGSPAGASSSTAGNRSTSLGETSADVTTSVSPAPASVSRTHVAQPERVVAEVRHRRFRQPRRHELVAADADDLLDEVRLDGQVATPARDRRIHHGIGARIDDERSGAARHRRPWSPRRPARSRSRPWRAARAVRRSRASSRAAGSRGPAGTPRAPAAARRDSNRRRRGRSCRRPTPRSGGPSGRRRAWPGATRCPSRTAGSRRTGAHSGRPSGGC